MQICSLTIIYVRHCNNCWRARWNTGRKEAVHEDQYLAAIGITPHVTQSFCTSLAYMYIQGAPIKNNPLEKNVYLSNDSKDLSQTLRFYR